MSVEDFMVLQESSEAPKLHFQVGESEGMNRTIPPPVTCLILSHRIDQLSKLLGHAQPTKTGPCGALKLLDMELKIPRPAPTPRLHRGISSVHENH